MLIYFKWPTLVLLFPMALILDLGLLLFAWKTGWLKEKLATYKYWLKKSSWKLWLGKRKNIQAKRQVSDRTLLKLAVGRVVFEEKAIDNPLLRYVGNPLMAGYWWIIRKLIWW